MRVETIEVYHANQPGDVCRLRLANDDCTFMFNLSLENLLDLNRVLLEQLKAKGGLGPETNKVINSTLIRIVNSRHYAYQSKPNEECQDIASKD